MATIPEGYRFTVAGLVGALTRVVSDDEEAMGWPVELDATSARWQRIMAVDVDRDRQRVTIRGA